MSKIRRGGAASSLIPLACVVVLALAAACSTTPVPGVCCVGPEDCQRLDLTEDRPCPAGQACVNLRCVVPSCSSQGCAAEAPVCDVATDACTGCTDSSDCSRFADTSVCDPQSGGCVECLADADCTGATEPVCERGTCRGCRLDTDCPSGACGDDGVCVAEAAIVYLDPAGQNLSPCSRSAPCLDLQFGIRQTTAARNHLVLTPGTYVTAFDVRISSAYTTASAIFVHGHGALVSGSSAEPLFDISVPTTVRDLNVDHPMGLAFAVVQGVFERVHIHASTGLQADGAVTAQDLSISVTGGAMAIYNQGSLTLDRAVLAGGAFGIQSFGFVDLKNVLVYGTSDTALDLGNSRGIVSFTTVADAGNASNIAGGLRCSSALAVRSSIFWTPGLRPAAAGECTFSSTIAGPIGVAGAMNVNPAFVDAASRNYHLGAASPARDMVDAGPATDIEGDPRPQGPRFDIGADEAR